MVDGAILLESTSTCPSLLSWKLPNGRLALFQSCTVGMPTFLDFIFWVYYGSSIDKNYPNFLSGSLSHLIKWPEYFCRVPCRRTDGLRFSFQGNGYWLLVYVMNVGGGGDIANMWVKGSKTGWISMSHNWGASYQAFATLGGQALSFKITSYTTKETIYAWNVAPANWNVGLTYKSNVNFHWSHSLATTLPLCLFLYGGSPILSLFATSFFFFW